MPTRDTRLSLTKQDLFKLTDAELSELQHSLGEYLDTPQEGEAKLLNQAIYQERDRR